MSSREFTITWLTSSSSPLGSKHGGGRLLISTKDRKVLKAAGDKNKRTLRVSVRLRASAKLPARSSGGPKTKPQRVLASLDGRHTNNSCLTECTHTHQHTHTNRVTEEDKPVRRCLMMNLRTAGTNCFSVRPVDASSQRNLHTIWQHKRQRLKTSFHTHAPVSRTPLHCWSTGSVKPHRAAASGTKPRV